MNSKVSVGGGYWIGKGVSLAVGRGHIDHADIPEGGLDKIRFEKALAEFPLHFKLWKMLVNLPLTPQGYIQLNSTVLIMTLRLQNLAPWV